MLRQLAVQNVVLVERLETVPAVRDGRVCTITDPYALLPGSRLAEVAERIAKCVHGEDVLNKK